jgi:deoxyribose-phosphate aldolase
MSNTIPTRAQVAAMIDHTLLAPEATDAEVAALCEEAADLGVHAVCVSPTRVATAVAALVGTSVAVASVIGFPSGAHVSAAKAAEAAAAVAHGAAELDMVIDLGAAMAGDWSAVTADVAAVRAAGPRPALLKVIIEAAVLGPDRLTAACAACEEAGADFVKTSTGFHPAGGATEAAVRAMSAAVGGRLGVKAAGGIRTSEQALAMVAAGATRLGLSHSRQILEGIV